MNNEILKHYFTDHQMAAVLGISVGGLRNKIYRKNATDLPESMQAVARCRLWRKEIVRAWLMRKYHKADVVSDLMEAGEKARPPGFESSGSATSAESGARKTRSAARAPARARGRPGAAIKNKAPSKSASRPKTKAT